VLLREKAREQGHVVAVRLEGDDRHATLRVK
jgi:hypothetical protein